MTTIDTAIETIATQKATIVRFSHKGQNYELTRSKDILFLFDGDSFRLIARLKPVQILEIKKITNGHNLSKIKLIK